MGFNTFMQDSETTKKLGAKNSFNIAANMLAQASTDPATGASRYVGPDPSKMKFEKLESMRGTGTIYDPEVTATTEAEMMQPQIIYGDQGDGTLSTGSTASALNAKKKRGTRAPSDVNLESAVLSGKKSNAASLSVARNTLLGR